MARPARGFSLIELVVTIGIIGLLATMVFAFVLPARGKARDARRKSDLSQIGRFLSLSCFRPQAGPGDYDIAVIAAELAAANPQYASFVRNMPVDPAKGSEAESFYRYKYADNGSCALYANLENEGEPVTLQYTEATTGGGRGVFEAAADGWNGTRKYLQFSN